MTTQPPPIESDDVRITSDDVPDEIVRTIHIDASAETVFAIISEPGWFINDGEYRRHEIESDGGVSRVVDPVHGEFSFGVEVLEPPRRAVFRFLGGVAEALEDFRDNTIEFTIEPDGEGVRLTVRERGFAGISSDAAVSRRRFEENTSGWLEELEVARTLAERAA